MTSVQFCFWLQGFFELQGPHKIRPDQVELIKKHLNMVFYHEIDPSYGSTEHQKKLSEIHSGVSASKTPKTDKALSPEIKKSMIKIVEEMEAAAKKNLEEIAKQKQSSYQPWVGHELMIKC